MIEHVDIALRDWLGAALDVDAVEFGRGPADEAASGRRKRAAPTVSLQLVGVTEQVDRRSNAIDDLRDGDGRVIGRRGAPRVFDLDYWCEVAGDPIDAHGVLGRLLQLLIGNDTIPVDFVPDDVVPTDLTMRDVPIEIDLAPPDVRGGRRSAMAGGGADSEAGVGVGAGVVVRATLPIWPTVDTQIGEPAVHLHLDVGPEPGASTRLAVDDTDDADHAEPNGGSSTPLERRWTTVRRREFIAPGSTAANVEVD